jgi:hypothetical protein
MDRLCIMQLNRMVKNDEVFRSVSVKMVRRSSLVHIMVLLKYLGRYGNQASLQNMGQMMGTSKGAMIYYVTRACSAVLKLCDQVIKWPNEEASKQISGRILVL